MGDSCSKMDNRDESDKQKKPPAFEEVSTSSAANITSSDLPPSSARGGPFYDVDQEQEEDGSEGDYNNNNNQHQHPDLEVESPAIETTKRRKKVVGLTGGIKKASSLFRVASRRTPASPARASNYSHVRDAVTQNFQEAFSERSRQMQLPLGVVGLRNLGNTCFMNSSLQCLSATIPLTDYFLGYDYRSEINKNNFLGTGGKLVVAYAELMKLIWLGTKNQVVKPTSFKSQLEKFAPQFVGTRQHDAQELLSFLLDGIHEDLNRIPKKPYIEDPDYDGSNDEQAAIDAWKNYLRRDKSLIVDVFQGQLRSSLQCLACGHRNIRFEPVMYLSLPILDSSRTLNDCLELYLAEEKLRGDNQWYCGKCKSHRDATRKTDIWILPPILIVHLKRFKFNEFGHIGKKNNAAIDYPITDWDLSSYVLSKGSERPLYDLYAVSNHVGGLGSGHYTAYAKGRFDDNWYEFNDSSCRRISDRTLRGNSSSAYLLFYNRIGNDANTSGRERSVPLIRRQSVSRPDLWPHTQVMDSQFRGFARHSASNLLAVPSLSSHAKEDDDGDDNGGGNSFEFPKLEVRLDEEHRSAI